MTDKCWICARNEVSWGNGCYDCHKYCCSDCGPVCIKCGKYESCINCSKEVAGGYICVRCDWDDSDTDDDKEPPVDRCSVCADGEVSWGNGCYECSKYCCSNCGPVCLTCGKYESCINCSKKVPGGYICVRCPWDDVEKKEEPPAPTSGSSLTPSPAPTPALL